jgi:iron complex outermembrane recepter protein
LFFTGIAGAIAPGDPDVGSSEQSSKGVNSHGVLTYGITDQMMIFGEAARGFRYGGMNEPAPVTFCATQLAALGLMESPESFGSEHLWSYTLGEKGTFVDGGLIVNIDGFYVLWDDVQSIHPLSSGYSYTEIAGKIKSRGVELESKVRAPTSNHLVGLVDVNTDGIYQPGNLQYWGRLRTIGLHAHVKF